MTAPFVPRRFYCLNALRVLGKKSPGLLALVPGATLDMVAILFGSRMLGMR